MKYSVSLKSNRDFRRLYSRGKQAVAPTMVLYTRKNRLKENRLGITTGKKLGNAVTRNRIRRRLREIYRLHEEEFLPGRPGGGGTGAQRLCQLPGFGTGLPKAGRQAGLAPPEKTTLNEKNPPHLEGGKFA